MEITRQIREYAEERGLETVDAVKSGLTAKSAEFREKGSKIYVES